MIVSLEKESKECGCLVSQTSCIFFDFWKIWLGCEINGYHMLY